MYFASRQHAAAFGHGLKRCDLRPSIQKESVVATSAAADAVIDRSAVGLLTRVGRQDSARVGGPMRREMQSEKCKMQTQICRAGISNFAICTLPFFKLPLLRLAVSGKYPICVRSACRDGRRATFVDVLGRNGRLNG